VAQHAQRVEHCGVRPIRVLVADRERAVAQALARSLAGSPDFAMIGWCSTLRDAEAQAVSERPDVVVLDERLAQGKLLSAIAELQKLRPEVAVVVTSPDADVNRALDAVRSGAAGFVAKDGDLREMTDTVRGVARGEMWVPPALLSGVLQGILGRSVPEDDRLARLTDREQQVLACMVRGLDRARIAQELILSINTVRTHTQNILAKLEVHSSLEAVSVALRSGFPVSQRPRAASRPSHSRATGAPHLSAPVR
jgi:DNA-binding NarL/FixJ family response regulator